MKSINPYYWTDDLRLLFFALVVSIAAITSVTFFTNSVKHGFDDKATDLLAADLRISSDRAFDNKWLQQADLLKLKKAQIAQMPTMAANQKMQMTLVSLKAVTELYPLRGQLSIKKHKQEFDAQAPVSGKVYIDKKLANKLNIFIGDKITLGYQQLVIDGIIQSEPDRVGSLFELAPRVLMNHNDLKASGLVVPGSRVKYRLLLSGKPEALQQYQQWAKTNCSSCQIESRENARPEIKDSLDKASDFLQLAVLVALILSGAAMAISAQQYSQNQLKNSVIMRAMGASNRYVLQQIFWSLLKLALFAILVGVLLGYIASLYLQQQLGQSIHFSANSWLQPILSGALTALIMTIGFALPGVLALKNVPVLSVLKKQPVSLNTSAWQLLLLSFSGLLFILLWNSQDYSMTMVFYAVLLIALASIYLLILGLSALLAKSHWVQQGIQSGWTMGLILFCQRRTKNSLQVTALASGVLVMVILTLLQKDILSLWQESFRQETANTFLMNVQKQDIDALKQQLGKMGINADFYPMVRGRLVAVNGVKRSASDYDVFRARRLMSRSFNLSWSERLPKANQLQAGQWWSKGSTPQLSLEKGLAETLGLKINDTLTFDIGGEKISGKVKNIRTLKWQSMQINFFVLFNPGWLETLPQTWVSSFYLPDSKQNELNRILQAYPYISQLNVAAILQQVKGIIDQVSQALRFVFLFTLISALLVLFASAAASRKVRSREIALQKVMGAGKNQLWQSLLVEYGLISLLSVIPATLVALLLGNYLAKHFFDLSSQFNLSSLSEVIPFALLLILASAWFANRKVIKTLPVQVLNSD